MTIALSSRRFAANDQDQQAQLPSWATTRVPAFGSPLPEDARPGFASLVLRLRLALRRDTSPQRMELLDQILDVAAESEQRMADQARRIAELEALCGSDELTGLPNRRAFESHMQRELAHARRHKGSGVLGFLDLDDFKGINDRHGHAAGDACLIHVARLLRQSARTTDYAGRLHGDEFAICLPGIPLVLARQRMNELCNTVASEPLLWGKTRIELGVSFGLAPYDADSDLPALLRDSDDAMYRHKQSKRLG
ncbi:GGDEF domain-containing protein [Ferrovibrio sp.]|uniref:GGDEF domain-containing protein n=1 Tax=Ferrovibrio sp. TaxID=1917215 RepID=UPI0025C27270|nr:GGDEF domain-containing protein [Ferrovibrio sp.]MBX3454477.1 GGDEF domain-containing protein [Ferrovibrio sp.]